MDKLFRCSAPADGTHSAPSKVSLLDLTEGTRYCEWWVVYHPRVPYFWWARYLKQGFRHVELWRPHSFGPLLENVVWLRLTPTFEQLESEIDFDPAPPWIRYPGSTTQRVQVLTTAFRVREWFALGPLTCVEILKSALGINSFFTRTPWQLYQYIERRGGVLRT